MPTFGTEQLLLFSAMRVPNQVLCSENSSLSRRLAHSFARNRYLAYKLCVLAILAVMPVRYTVYLLTTPFEIRNLVRLIYDCCELVQFVLGSTYFATSHFDECMGTQQDSFRFSQTATHSLRRVVNEVALLTDDTDATSRVLDRNFSCQRRLVQLVALVPICAAVAFSLFLVPTSRSWRTHGVALTLLFSLSGFFGRLVHLINLCTFMYVFYVNGIALKVVIEVLDKMQASELTVRCISRLYHALSLLRVSLRTSVQLLMPVLLTQILSSAVTIYIQFIYTRSREFWTARNATVTLVFFLADACLFLVLNFIFSLKDTLRDQLHAPSVSEVITKSADVRQQLVYLILMRLFNERWIEFEICSVRVTGFGLTIRVLTALSLISIFIRTGVLTLTL